MSTSTDADFVPAVLALGFHLATAVSLLVAVAARQWLLCGAVVAIAAVAFVVTQFVQFVPRATTEQTQLQQFQIQNQQIQHQLQMQTQQFQMMQAQRREDWRMPLRAQMSEEESTDQGNAPQTQTPQTQTPQTQTPQTQMQQQQMQQGAQGSSPLATQRAFDQSVHESLQAVTGTRINLDAQVQFDIERMTLLATQFQREQDVSYWNT